MNSVTGSGTWQMANVLGMLHECLILMRVALKWPFLPFCDTLDVTTSFSSSIFYTTKAYIFFRWRVKNMLKQLKVIF